VRWEGAPQCRRLRTGSKSSACSPRPLRAAAAQQSPDRSCTLCRCKQTSTLSRPQSSFTAPLAWAACQLQHLPRYPSLIRNAQACPPGLPTRSRRTPFPAVAAHSNRSLLGAVSVAGKRNFEARDKGAEMAVGIHLAARRDHAPARKPANSGLFAKSREKTAAAAIKCRLIDLRSA
jgi:hypothetical protein